MSHERPEYVFIDFTHKKYPNKKTAIAVRKNDYKVFVKGTSADFFCAGFDGVPTLLNDGEHFEELEWWLHEHIKKNEDKEKIITSITKTIKREFNDENAEILLESKWEH